jgi:hypothetical protein
MQKADATLVRRVLPALVALILACLSLSASAVDIRGRVDVRNAYSPRPFPLAGATVTLFVRQPTGWRVIANASTGPDGLYYFRGVAPGSYVLQVQGRNFPITLSQASFQDVPPLLVQR